jgi:hypothetical protein
MKTKSTYLFGAFGLAMVAMIALFAFDVVTERMVITEEAHAWTCQSMTATPDTVYAGEAVLLEWSFGAFEHGVTVTIDQLPGQTFDIQDSVEVFPTETTKYRAVAHKEGVDYVFDCCVTVTVKPPQNTCDAVNLHIDEYEFTFSGPPALSYYQVEFCDGTETDKIEGTWGDVETITFDKEIKRVHTKGGQCELEASRTCNPPEEPKVPQCPFVESDNLTVIDFNGGKDRNSATLIRSDQTESRSYIQKSLSLEAGTYTVKTASWDGYLARVNVTQPNEQWNVETRSGSTILGSVGPTTDIKDKVIEDMQTDTFTYALTFDQHADTVAVTHAVYPDKSSANSVVPVCVAFEKKPEVKEPWCEMSSNPDTIDEGGSATITWNSEHVTSVDITNIGTGLALASSTTVSPATTTTYVGTFYTNNDPLTCEATVTVRPPEPVPSCELIANPKTIEEGNTALISWSSENVTSVDITNIGTGLSVASSTMVSPATTTTYIGTFYGINDEVLTCEDTVTVVPPQEEPNPICAMSIAPSTVYKGSNATLSWTSDDVVSASIDNGIGDVSVNGSQQITVQNNTTYTGTFIGEDDTEITCTANVSIRTGGGSCINCGDDDDDDDDDRDPDPSIVLGKTTTKTGSFITLNKVPYTGFEAGPLLTTFFWFMVAIISVFIAYLMTRFNPIARIRYALVGEKTDYYNNTPITSNTQLHVQESVVTEDVIAPVITMNASNQTNYTGQHNISEIEEIAHAENILLSPEALRLIQKELSNTDAEATTFFTKLFEQAKAEFPREDGWILLSKERVEQMLGITNEAVTATDRDTQETERPFRVAEEPIGVTAQQKRSETIIPTQEPMSVAYETQQTSSPTNNVVSKFTDHIIGVQKKEAFDLLRNVSTRGVDISTFMTLVVRQLDEVYKHRIEGIETSATELVAKTSSWSNQDFETILGILVECIDYSYSNNRIGTKIALAKAFEHFEKKQ